MTTAVRLFRIDSIGKGYLAVTAQPAQNGDAEMSIRDMAMQDIHQVVSLLDTVESRALGLEHEAELVSGQSMHFVSYPIPDMGLPVSVGDFARLSLTLFQQIESGVNTLIHCRGGIGRSGLLAAAVLLHGGRNVQQAFAQVSLVRGEAVPETEQQGDWLRVHHESITAGGEQVIRGLRV